MIRALVIAGLLIATTAHAEPESDWLIHSGAIAPHITTGMEAMGGAKTSSFTWRTYAGLDIPLGTGGVRPTLGIGATFALGTLRVEDPRAESGTLSLGYYEAGPELRLGLRFINGGLVDKQLFASFAYLRTDLDDRLMIDAVEGVEGTRGMRGSIGFNYAETIGRVIADDFDSGHGGYAWIIAILPQQVELTFERSCGSDRMGAIFSWGI